MKGFKITIAAIGFAIFFFMLAELGWENVLLQLRRVGWGFLAIVALRSFSHTIFAWAWHWNLPRAERKVPFGALLRARLAGEAFNYLIPSASMGGEPVKARLLKAHLSWSSGLASVTVAKYSFVLAQLLIMILGGSLALATVDLPPGIRLALVLPLVIIAVGLAVLYYGQRRGMFGWLSRTLAAWHVGRPFLHARLEKIKRMDEAIASVYQNQGRDFVLSLVLNLVGWAEGIVEIFLILVFLGLSTSWVTAFVIESLSLIISAALFFVPWQAGTQEAGKVLIFQIMGLGPAAGLALGLIRRIRELVWVGIGLLCLATFGDKAEVMRDQEVLERIG